MFSSKPMIKGLSSIAYLTLRSLAGHEKSGLRCLLTYKITMNFLAVVLRLCF